MPEGGMPYAGTPEMDLLVQQINQQPAIMKQLPPQLLAEVLKHLGIAPEQVKEASEWMDEAADATTGKVPTDETDEEEVATAPIEEDRSSYATTEEDEDEAA